MKRVLLLSLLLRISGSTSTCADDDDRTCATTEPPTFTLLNRSPEHLILKISRNSEQGIIDLSDGVYISIKTTLKYHSTRLPPIIFTWLQNISPSQIHLVTDSDDTNQNDVWLKTAQDNGFDIIFANCSIGHQRDDLCCKSGVEYDNYYSEKGGKYRWFCHFDDDVYVNIPMLIDTLSKYKPSQEKVYIGRWPLAVEEIQVPKRFFLEAFPIHEREGYRYATGAAYCITASLMTEVEEYFRGSHFTSNCKKVRLTDDMLVGCVIGAVLGHKLTNDKLFNSNLNSMRFPPSLLKQQVAVSYGVMTSRKNSETLTIRNRLSIPNAAFSEEEDPTRFFSYHCYLYPNTRWCRK